MRLGVGELRSKNSGFRSNVRIASMMYSSTDVLVKKYIGSWDLFSPARLFIYPSTP